MKIFNLICYVLLLMSCNKNPNNTLAEVSVKAEQQETQVKRYKVKSGIIKYETTISGKVMGSTVTGSGTERKYFKAYGALELVEEESSQTTVANVFGNKSTNTTETHTMKKLDNGDSYTVDFKQKKIYKIKDPAMELTKTYEPNADAGKVGEDMLKAIGGKKTGTDTYKGYDCEIWEALGVKQWIYKGVTLKTVGTLMGITTTTEATSIEFNIDVPDANFNLPDFPIEVPQSVFEDIEMNDTDYDADLEDIDQNLKLIKNMTFEEWKTKATEHDEEMRNMSDDELRETYNMIQKMIKMRGL